MTDQNQLVQDPRLPMSDQQGRNLPILIVEQQAQSSHSSRETNRPSNRKHTRVWQGAPLPRSYHPRSPRRHRCIEPCNSFREFNPTAAAAAAAAAAASRFRQIGSMLDRASRTAIYMANLWLDPFTCFESKDERDDSSDRRRRCPGGSAVIQSSSS